MGVSMHFVMSSAPALHDELQCIHNLTKRPGFLTGDAQLVECSPRPQPARDLCTDPRRYTRSSRQTLRRYTRAFLTGIRTVMEQIALESAHNSLLRGPRNVHVPL